MSLFSNGTWRKRLLMLRAKDLIVHVLAAAIALGLKPCCAPQRVVHQLLAIYFFLIPQQQTIMVLDLR